MEEPVIVLDNGGGSLKVGVANVREQHSIFPNACARIKGERQSLLADQICSCPELSTLTLKRPMDRGYVVNWDLERTIWERSFNAIHLVPDGLGLLVTEPLFTLPSLQQQMDQVVFEDFQFASCQASSCADLCLTFWTSDHPTALSNTALTGLIVDCGYSFSTVVPVFDGSVILEGVQRIDLGGKALTNFLKELVSFRSINMMEEQHLMEHIKEQTVFASHDLAKDLLKAKEGEFCLDYVLPDGLTSGSGFIHEPHQRSAVQDTKTRNHQVPILRLNNERFLVPELLFSPSSVGLNQAGLPEAILQSTEKCHPDIRPLLLSNVLCCGGMFKCPGFSSRLASEIRALVSSESEVKVHVASDPSLTAWLGGNSTVLGGKYTDLAFSKMQYEEEGSKYMRRVRAPVL